MVYTWHGPAASQSDAEMSAMYLLLLYSVYVLIFLSINVCYNSVPFNYTFCFLVSFSMFLSIKKVPFPAATSLSQRTALYAILAVQPLACLCLKEGCLPGSWECFWIAAKHFALAWNISMCAGWELPVLNIHWQKNSLQLTWTIIWQRSYITKQNKTGY